MCLQVEPLQTPLNPLEATTIISEALKWAQAQIKSTIMICCSIEYGEGGDGAWDQT